MDRPTPMLVPPAGIRVARKPGTPRAAVRPGSRDDAARPRRFAGNNTALITHVPARPDRKDLS